jgi:hypothetical protein
MLRPQSPPDRSQSGRATTQQFPVTMLGAFLAHGNEFEREHLQRFNTGLGGTRQGGTEGSRSPLLCRPEPAHARSRAAMTAHDKR